MALLVLQLGTSGFAETLVALAVLVSTLAVVVGSGYLVYRLLTS